ncbi:recombination protein NinG [Variovorax sp. GT1P44]|uniref:recombination protein NinG n=1 Tax=Variovorax sp. GT1P44 TaxID=3443742 RepID=UPI003F4505C2
MTADEAQIGQGPRHLALWIRQRSQRQDWPGLYAFGRLCRLDVLEGWPLIQATLKPKTCAHCEASFMPARLMQKVCSPICARRKVEADKKAEKAQFKARKEAIKPIRELVAAAQDAFNDYIRARDAALPCISCDETNPPMTSGGQWDAGHYKGRGAFPELRFDEDNCHKQCKGCNGGSKHPGKARTVAANYEERLIKRIGAERVARLNGPHELLKLDRDTLRQIKVIYRAKARELKKGQA